MARRPQVVPKPPGDFFRLGVRKGLILPGGRLIIDLVNRLCDNSITPGSSELKAAADG